MTVLHMVYLSAISSTLSTNDFDVELHHGLFYFLTEEKSLQLWLDNSPKFGLEKLKA